MFSPDRDVESVEAFLRERFGPVDDVAPIGSGEWSQAFSFRSHGRELVVRFGRFRQDYEKDRRAMAFASEDLPVPEILEIGDAFDGCYAISRRAFGVGFDALKAEGYLRVLPAVFRLLDALRRVDVSATRGYGIWEPDGTAPYASWRETLLDVVNDYPGSRIGGWKKQMARQPEAVENFEAGYRALQAMVEVCPEDRHVIHGDLMGDNLLVRDDRVVAALDWGNAMYGDFLYDLARIAFWVPWFPEMHGLDLPELARRHYASVGFDVPEFDARLRCYWLHLGLDAQVYNAFTRRWDELARSGRRTLQLGLGEVAS